MLSLDTLPKNKPEDLVERFSLCVDGELNESTLGFLHSINKANPFGLGDLITKLHHIEIHPKAELVAMTVQVLTSQLKIPHNALDIIQDFLQEEGKQTILTELQSLDLNEVKLHQSVRHIMDNLHIFSGDNLAEQFLRTIISIMLEWDANPQRSVQEAAKWLKSVFNVPYKSTMSQIIQLIADHLHLSDCLMEGKNRNMDCLELFFLLKNITNHTEIVLVTETNKAFMLQINAAVLAIMIYKNAQNAFYDVVAWHTTHPDFAILKELSEHQSSPMVLEKFIQSHAFKPYYSQQRYQDSQVNHHVFMSSMAAYLRTIMESDLSCADLNLVKIISFVKQCSIQFRDKDRLAFLQWYQNNPQFELLEPQILALLLHTIQRMAVTQKSRHAGRIRASAMQLVTLGYSHRSASTLTTGVFKPLVNIDIAAIDSTNISALIAFFNQQTLANRLRLLQEIFLGYLIYNQGLQLSYQEKNKIQARQTKSMVLLNTPKLKSTFPQVFRVNPLNRNRMFTPKIPVNKTVPVYAMTGTAHLKKSVDTLTSPSIFEAAPLAMPMQAPGLIATPTPPLKRRKRALARKFAKKRAMPLRNHKFF